MRLCGHVLLPYFYCFHICYRFHYKMAAKHVLKLFRFNELLENNKIIKRGENGLVENHVKKCNLINR